MPKPFLGVRISNELNEAIAIRMQETGQSRSDIAIAALQCYLGMTPCHERLKSIEQRLAVLEGQLAVGPKIPADSPSHSPSDSPSHSPSHS